MTIPAAVLFFVASLLLTLSVRALVATHYDGISEGLTDYLYPGRAERRASRRKGAVLAVAWGALALVAAVAIILRK